MYVCVIVCVCMDACRSLTMYVCVGQCRCVCVIVCVYMDACRSLTMYVCVGQCRCVCVCRCVSIFQLALLVHLSVSVYVDTFNVNLLDKWREVVEGGRRWC